MFVTHRVVVGIEEYPEGLVEGLETPLPAFQNEGFKKPGGMTQMPFDRVVSAIDCTQQSSAESGAARATVDCRTAW